MGFIVDLHICSLEKSSTSLLWLHFGDERWQLMELMVQGRIGGIRIRGGSLGGRHSFDVVFGEGIAGQEARGWWRSHPDAIRAYQLK